jgi:hypothetical protein
MRRQLLLRSDPLTANQAQYFRLSRLFQHLSFMQIVCIISA